MRLKQYLIEVGLLSSDLNPLLVQFVCIAVGMTC